MKTVIKKEWMGTIRPNIHLAAIALLVFACISGAGMWIGVYQIFPLLFSVILLEILSISENRRNGSDSVEQILFSMKDRLLGGWALAGIIALICLLIALAVFSDAGLAFSTGCILMVFPAAAVPVRVLVCGHEHFKSAFYLISAVFSISVSMIFSLTAEMLILHRLFLETAPEHPYRFCWLAVPVTISFICSVVIADRLESVKK